MLDVLTYLFYLLSKPNTPIKQICAAKVQQKMHICKKFYKKISMVHKMSTEQLTKISSIKW